MPMAPGPGAQAFHMFSFGDTQNLNYSKQKFKNRPDGLPGLSGLGPLLGFDLPPDNIVSLYSSSFEYPMEKSSQNLR